MKEETKDPVDVEDTQSERNDTRRSVLKGAAAAAAAAVAASVPRNAAAATWPCATSVRGPYGTLTMQEMNGTISVRVVLDGISDKVAQEITFEGRTPSALRGVAINQHGFGAWVQSELLCW